MRRVRVRLNATIGLLALCIVVCGHAETIPARGTVDSRIRSTSYSAEEVYRLRGVVGYAIELIFEDGESFAGTGGGDLEGVTIDAHANSVLLKPKAAIVATNLVVFTDRRAYRFDYAVSPRSVSSHANDMVYAIRFVYPPRDGQSSGESAESRVERELAQAKTGRPLNTDYWFCGKKALKPTATTDDGVHTRITFGSAAEIPAIFVRNDDGTESLLNYSMDGGDVVIHRIAPRFILRRGRTTGCIVNKGYAGAGLRLESGTVSPAVKRAVKEERP